MIQAIASILVSLGLCETNMPVAVAREPSIATEARTDIYVIHSALVMPYEN